MPTNWYDNKDLFEMIQDLKREIPELKKEMESTKVMIRNYNGLREQQINFEKELTVVKQCLKNNQENKKNWQWVLGWVVAVASLLIALYK